MTEKMQDVENKLYSLFHENNRVFAEAVNDESDNKSRTMFFDSRALFWFDVSSRAAAYRAEEIDFGIIPIPKYDEAQDRYRTISDQWGMVCAVPVSATDTERTGVITEALCAASLRYIVPAYYDIVLTGKAIRDVESEKMLDMIFDGITYTFYHFYSGSMKAVLSGVIKDGSTGLSSWYEANSGILYNHYNEIYRYMNE